MVLDTLEACSCEVGDPSALNVLFWIKEGPGAERDFGRKVSFVCRLQDLQSWGQQAGQNAPLFC